MDVVFSWLLRKGKNPGGGEAAFISISGSGGWMEAPLSGCAQNMFKEGEEEGTRIAAAAQSGPDR